MSIPFPRARACLNAARTLPTIYQATIKTATPALDTTASAAPTATTMVHRATMHTAAAWCPKAPSRLKAGRIKSTDTTSPTIQWRRVGATARARGIATRIPVARTARSTATSTVSSNKGMDTDTATARRLWRKAEQGQHMEEDRCRLRMEERGGLFRWAIQETRRCCRRASCRVRRERRRRRRRGG